MFSTKHRLTQYWPKRLTVFGLSGLLEGTCSRRVCWTTWVRSTLDTADQRGSRQRTSGFQGCALCRSIWTCGWGDVIADFYRFWKIEQSPQMCQLTSNHLEQRQDTLNETTKTLQQSNSDKRSSPSIYHTGNKGKWQYLKNECMDKYFQQHLIAIGMICILRIPHTDYGFGELWKLREKARPGAW